MNGDIHYSTFLYFSYGSNLMKERIHINNPTAEIYGVGKLTGWKLTYDVPIDYEPSLWYGASATIRPGGPDDYVYGVVWKIKSEDMAYLDSQETYYQPIDVLIEMENGELVKCRSYEMHKNTSGNHLPSPHYKEIIVRGAKQNKLPEDYIRYLKSFPDNGLSSPPPNYLKVMDVVQKLANAAKKNSES
ncbi:gamma-glutamylcyclotransferase-like isoform X2 [Physella acuta]|uniref:gamma-glutamylcyclotransferase-like isoform X2 n=1 Tax=Physella acuta TaxID=109671 RepID=UPI0027DDDCCE|nr:gamma-glutamylcyclotransferase-like isoform X2 [Physella acuta]